MKALERFEDLIEQYAETSFVRLLGGQLQPVELAKRLIRAMEGHQTIGPDKVIVPNKYEILLNPQDYTSFASWHGFLEQELASYLIQYAREHRFTLYGQATVAVKASDQVKSRTATVRVDLIDIQEPPRAAAPVALEAGHTQRLSLREMRALAHPLALFVLSSGEGAYPMDKASVSLGRSLDNDVVLEDSRVSRHHARVRREGKGFVLEDLGSANGTWVNGKAVTRGRVADGDVLSLGGLELVFQVPTERHSHGR
ncbi:MAG: DUF3662 and FHA domain-containing protein [Chloroflexi bacterium]|nr:DUF3662 and FHA domain-containing protein [Chloroflexota bacterium]